MQVTSEPQVDNNDCWMYQAVVDIIFVACFPAMKHARSTLSEAPKYVPDLKWWIKTGMESNHSFQTW